MGDVENPREHSCIWLHGKHPFHFEGFANQGGGALLRSEWDIPVGRNGILQGGAPWGAEGRRNFPMRRRGIPQEG
jgi:hypothetical protein